MFPLKDGQNSEYRLYEDAGDTPGYQFGESVWTPIRAASSADGTVLTVSVAPAEGHYKGMRTERAYELRLPGSWPPSSVSVNGEALRVLEEGGGARLALRGRYVDNCYYNAQLPRHRRGEGDCANQVRDGAQSGACSMAFRARWLASARHMTF